MTNARVVVPSSSSINDASVCNTIYSTYFFFTLLLHPFAPRSHCFGYPGIPLNKYDQAKLRTRINCVEILMCLEWAFGLILLRKRTIFPRFEPKLFTISNMIYATSPKPYLHLWFKMEFHIFFRVWGDRWICKFWKPIFSFLNDIILNSSSKCILIDLLSMKPSI